MRIVRRNNNLISFTGKCVSMSVCVVAAVSVNGCFGNWMNILFNIERVPPLKDAILCDRRVYRHLVNYCFKFAEYCSTRLYRFRFIVLECS